MPRGGKEVCLALDVRLTYDNYLLFPDDRRIEILDGRRYDQDTPYTRHQEVLVQLAIALNVFARANRLGKVLMARLCVVLSAHDIVEPDLLFVSRPRLPLFTEWNFQGAPDLIAEILSDSTRSVDDGIKRDRYEAAGVREYWLVDPDRETVTVHRLKGERFEMAAELSGQDVLTTPLLPGLEVRLGEIFANY